MSPKVNRKWLRHQVHWEVKTFNGQPVEETFLFNLSAFGAKIEGTKPLTLRNHVEFTYVRPGDDRERSHRGVVLWMRPLIHKPGYYQMGVKFYHFDWALDLELRQGQFRPIPPSPEVYYPLVCLEPGQSVTETKVRLIGIFKETCTTMPSTGEFGFKNKNFRGFSPDQDAPKNHF